MAGHATLTSVPIGGSEGSEVRKGEKIKTINLKIFKEKNFKLIKKLIIKNLGKFLTKFKRKNTKKYGKIIVIIKNEK